MSRSLRVTSLLFAILACFPIRGTAEALGAIYHFNEAGGTTATDDSGAGHDATIVGATRVTGFTGGALRFAGGADRVVVPLATFNTFANTAYFEAMIRPASNTGAETRLFIKRAPHNDWFLGLTPQGRVMACLYTPSRPISGFQECPQSADGAAPIGTWTRVAMYYDGTTLHLYINGSEVGQHALNLTIDWTTNYQFTQLGNEYNDGGQYAYVGDIDDVLIATARPSDCSFTINPDNLNLGPGGFGGTVTVSTQQSCAWTATPDPTAPWVTFTSPTSGNGNGNIGYSVAANLSVIPRTATLTIAGKSFTLTQQGRTPLPCCTEILDPVPTLLSGAKVTTSASLLARSGRPVGGVAADGISRVVLRIPTNRPGERITLTVLNESGHPTSSIEQDGSLETVGETLQNLAVLSVTAQSDMPVAFAVYRSPVEFVRSSTTDSQRSERQVHIDIESEDGGRESTPIKVVRPPVLLVHGIWSGPSAWDFFCTPVPGPTKCPNVLGPQFKTYRVNYESTNDEGFLTNARTTYAQMTSELSRFKCCAHGGGVASVQFDVLAHSMGGNIIRMIVAKLAYLRDENYKKGDIHKFIPIDSPLLGSQYAARVLDLPLACRSLFWVIGKPVGPAVEDLAPGSQALMLLQQKTTPMQTHLIVGEADELQTQSAESWVRAIELAIFATTFAATRRPLLCSLLPLGGFSRLFNGPSDLIVSSRSQQAVGLGYFGNTLPFSRSQSTVHTVSHPIFTKGPSSQATNIIDGRKVGVFSTNVLAVIDLLNSPIDSGSFGSMLP